MLLQELNRALWTKGHCRQSAKMVCLHGMMSCMFLQLLQGCAQSAFEEADVRSVVEDVYAELPGRDEALLAMRMKVDHSMTSLKCHASDAPEHPELVVGVKTNRFYHATRVRALWKAWGHQLGHALFFVTDAPLQEAADWPASVIVVGNSVDGNRHEAYVPPWRSEGEDAGNVDPFALPQLTRRVAALFEAMYGCWGNAAKWYLLVDDDTFVRPDFLLHMVAGKESKELHFLGRPTNSDQFTLPRHQKKYGSSIHCGGSSILLSSSLVERVADFAEGCLHGPPRTTLAWYWDEVELLGRCLYEHLRLNCSEIPTSPSNELPGEVAMGTMMAVGSQDDYDALDAYVTNVLRGDWNRLPLATLHPVEAPYMRWLGRRFGTAAPRATYPTGVNKRELVGHTAEEL